MAKFEELATTRRYSDGLLDRDRVGLDHSFATAGKSSQVRFGRVAITKLSTLSKIRRECQVREISPGAGYSNPHNHLFEL